MDQLRRISLADRGPVEATGFEADFGIRPRWLRWGADGGVKWAEEGDDEEEEDDGEEGSHDAPALDHCVGRSRGLWTGWNGSQATVHNYPTKDGRSTVGPPQLPQPPSHSNWQS